MDSLSETEISLVRKKHPRILNEEMSDTCRNEDKAIDELSMKGVHDSLDGQISADSQNGMSPELSPDNESEVINEMPEIVDDPRPEQWLSIGKEIEQQSAMKCRKW
jgi:hypothetical protein